MPIHAPLWGVWGHIPPNDVTYRPNPKKVRAGRVNEKKRTGQDRKKVTKGLYFTYLQRSPHEAMYMKICVVGDVLDVITCAKFQNEIFRG